ncbi:hypothetical protein Tco_1425065 [Tanacetum coccineum]
MTDTQTSSFESPLKVDKDWKEKFFYPANHVESVKGCGSNTSKNVSEVEPKKVRKNNDAPIIEDWVSDDEEQEFAQEDGSKTKPEKKTVIPTAAKIEKPVRKPVKYAEMYRSQRPRGNQRNWNGQKSNQLGLGNNYNKKDNDYYSKTSHPSAHKHMAPRAVLMKTGLKSFNTARPVNTVRSVNTGRPFSTARPFRSTVNTVRARGFNAVKPSACWVWRPIKLNGASLVFNKYNYIDAQGKSNNSQLNDKGFVDSGCSRHMTGNIAHLSDFKDFDGGYVTFGGGAYGGRITGKDKDGLQDKNDATEKSYDDSSLKDNGTAVQQVNTARLEINTGSREVSTAVPEVYTATPEELVGPSHAYEDTQVENQEIELGNIPQSYAVPTTPHTRIHKDHPIEHVIGDVQSSVQTRRMTTSYSE